MPSKHKLPRKMARKAPGSILIAVIISCAVLLILLGTLASFAELLQSQSGRQIRDFQASYLAEAGVNYLIANPPSSWTATPAGPGQSLSTTISPLGKIRYRIDANNANFPTLFVKAGVPKDNPLTCRTVTVIIDKNNGTGTVQAGGYDLSPATDCSNNNW